MDTTNSAPSKQSIAIAVPAVVLVVAATAVGLRFYTRYALVKHVGPDDWAVAMAYVGNFLPPTLAQRWLPFMILKPSQSLTLACGISVALSKLTPWFAPFNCIDTMSDTANGLGLHVWMLQPGDTKSFMRVCLLHPALSFPAIY